MFLKDLREVNRQRKIERQRIWLGKKGKREGKGGKRRKTDKERKRVKDKEKKKERKKEGHTVQKKE